MRFLANLCNSTTVEVYSDIIRVSHGFSRIDMLFFIDTCNSASEAGNDGITVFWPLTLADRLEVPAILTNFVSKLQMIDRSKVFGQRKKILL